MSFFLYELLKRRNNGEKDPSFTDLQLKYASSAALCSLSYELDSVQPEVMSHKIFNLLDENGHWQAYQITPINLDQEGLKPYVIFPVDKSSKEVKIVFRGTADRASLWRDLEPGSPGAVSFEKSKETIFNQLLKLTREQYPNGQDLTLTIAGHSLGGSDAENFANYCCTQFAQAKNTAPFKNLNVYPLNSPGITHHARDLGVEAVGEIKKYQSDFKPNVYYGKIEHDPVQQLGQNHFLNGVEPSLATLTLIKLKKNFSSQNIDLQYLSDFNETLVSLTKQLVQYVYRGIHAHRLKTYFTSDKYGKLSNLGHGFKLLSNQSPEQCHELNAELSNKATYVLYMHKILAGDLNYLPSRNNSSTLDEVTNQMNQMNKINKMAIR